jgi:hypothetical protein
MIETEAEISNWVLPVWGALGAVFLLLPIALLGNDVRAFLLMVPLAVVIGIVLLVIATRRMKRHRLGVFFMFLIFLALSWVLFRNSDDVRTHGRWLIHSKSYKAQVLNQSGGVIGELKHIEWEGWGFAGEDTVVYLVFDPNDALAAAANDESSWTYKGLPCPVYQVHRLERYWYTAFFYTDTDWQHCQ